MRRLVTSLLTLCFVVPITGASSPVRLRQSTPGTPGKSLTPTQPSVWFHDIFHPDGSPYSSTEVEYIRAVTGTRK